MVRGRYIIRSRQRDTTINASVGLQPDREWHRPLVAHPDLGTVSDGPLALRGTGMVAPRAFVLDVHPENRMAGVPTPKR
jgi:hypothetical protein